MDAQKTIKKLTDENDRLRRELADSEEVREAQRKEIVHLKAEVAAGTPEQLKALRDLSDTNQNTIVELRHEIQTLKRKLG